MPESDERSASDAGGESIEIGRQRDRRRISAGVAAAAVLVITILAVGAFKTLDGDDETASPASAAKAQISHQPTEEPVVCPNPYGGGFCLGKLEGDRTYSTESFTPQFTYRVPDDGWSNMEDLPGNFLLLPPGRGVGGVDAGKVDYLGVYSGVTVAAADCVSHPMPGVGLEPEAIVTALTERPGLDVTAPQKVYVGGHDGLLVGIELVPGTHAGCNVEGVGSVIPLTIGAGPADLEHAQFPGLQTSLYVLDNGRSNIIVEISDVTGDERDFNFTLVVNELSFAPA